MGPILDEFRQKREELVEQLRAPYAKALAQQGRGPVPSSLSIRVTAQGGIGTAEEDCLLRERYGVDGTGWATPFLLVPEVSNVDEEHLRKLCEATADDVFLSESSPFGVPFWNLRTSASEEARRRRIAENRPGSGCSRGYVKLFNTEFTETPICTASRAYQEAKLRQLQEADLTDEQRRALTEGVLAKSCICRDLAGGATIKNGIDPTATTAVCCGPNIVHFSKLASLEEMVGHIYGRLSLLNDLPRPHMFLRELAISIDYLRNEMLKQRIGIVSYPADYFREYGENLLEGVRHYRQLASHLAQDVGAPFLERLESLQQEVVGLMPADSDP
jgi:hypothetical protein